MNRYTQEQIDAADSIDLVAYAQSRGYELEREGNQYKMKNIKNHYLYHNMMLLNHLYQFIHLIKPKDFVYRKVLHICAI